MIRYDSMSLSWDFQLFAARCVSLFRLAVGRRTSGIAPVDHPQVANLDGTNLDQQDVSLYLSGQRPMEEVYPNWPKTQQFLRDIQGVVAPARRGSLSFEEITHVVEEIHEHYGRWHDEVDCQEMKNVPGIFFSGYSLGRAIAFFVGCFV